VIYRGNPAARLMIIGEAPGAEEDQQGKPFVGKSGQLLDQILRSVSFDPAVDVFVTNAVFRRPPGNRVPTPEEITWYRPYLLELVRLVDPPVILLVGSVATRSILDEKRGITQIRGQWFPWHGRLAMPIFHPAYLLRTPASKRQSWIDLLNIRERLDQISAG
jgi:DNA polymerase